MEDIVILRVVNGSDFFCIFTGLVEEEGVERARKSIRIHKVGSSSTVLKAVDGGMVDFDSDEEN